MVSDRIAWPRKTRELRTQLFDSSVWNEFRFRPDDVVIATYGKAGTTWTQQIVAQLIFGGRLFKGGARTFIHKGTNGRWRDVLSAGDCRRYEALAQERLGWPCARWLAEGGSIDRDSRRRPAWPGST